MLADVGLPKRIVSRLPHLFTIATDEGILEALESMPMEVRDSDHDNPARARFRP